MEKKKKKKRGRRREEVGVELVKPQERVNPAREDPSHFPPFSFFLFLAFFSLFSLFINQLLQYYYIYKKGIHTLSSCGETNK